MPDQNTSRCLMGRAWSRPLYRLGSAPGSSIGKPVPRRHLLAVDATPEVQGPGLAVRHHLVVEFDDHGVEMDDVALNGILLLEDDLRLVARAVSTKRIVVSSRPSSSRCEITLA